jgi:hypothetical protein
LIRRSKSSLAESAIGETPLGASNKSFTAGFKQSW